MQDRRRLIIALLALAAVAGAGCSDSGGGSGSGSGGSGSQSNGGGEPVPEDETLAIGWIGVDGATVSAVKKAFPGRIATRVARDVSDPAAAATELASSGARLIVSTVPGACSGAPETHCLEPAAGTEPSGSTSVYDLEFWTGAFLLGRAAGLLTESDVTGFVSVDDSPQTRAAVNSWALGCQTSNPNCVTRLAPAAPGVGKRLLRANADVIATAAGDGAICSAAEKKNVPVVAVPAGGVGCATPVVALDLAPVLEKEVESELAGDWSGGRTIEVGPAPLAWGDGATSEVRSKVEKAAEQLAAGRKVFAGPLFDNQGQEQVPEGEELTPEFISSQWTWLVGGVIQP